MTGKLLMGELVLLCAGAAVGFGLERAFRPSSPADEVQSERPAPKPIAEVADASRKALERRIVTLESMIADMKRREAEEKANPKPADTNLPPFIAAMMAMRMRAKGTWPGGSLEAYRKNDPEGYAKEAAAASVPQKEAAVVHAANIATLGDVIESGILDAEEVELLESFAHVIEVEDAVKPYYMPIFADALSTDEYNAMFDARKAAEEDRARLAPQVRKTLLNAAMRDAGLEGEAARKAAEAIGEIFKATVYRMHSNGTDPNGNATYPELAIQPKKLTIAREGATK